MIDYEKIKLAYELFDKTNYYLCISIIRENYDYDVPLRTFCRLIANKEILTFDDLDSLIAKLKELTND